AQGVYTMLVSFVVAAIAVALYCWLLLTRLRRLPWWDGAVAEVRAVLARACARLRGLCGNSKTIAVAYARLQGAVMIKRASFPLTVFQEQASNAFSLVLSVPCGVPATRRARWPDAPIPRPWAVR